MDDEDREGGGRRDRGGDDAPAERAGVSATGGSEVSSGGDGNPIVAFFRDVAISVAIVAGIAVVLFGVSGIWPPMVAIESGSMEPHMSKGDLVFVVNEARFQPDGVEAHEGVVPMEVAEEVGYERFGAPGDVIVFAPNGNTRRRAVIHRAIRWVEDGEQWTDADGDVHRAQHEGFLTRGDANPDFDQADGISGPVRPRWIRGKAKYSIPVVGNIRLLFPFRVGVPPV